MAFAAATDAAHGVITLALTGAGVATATIARVDSAGNLSVIRNGDPATLTGGAWTGLDYEAPLDVPVSYQVTNVSSSAVLATSNTVTLASGGQMWLGHPGKPALNITPLVGGIQPGTRKARSATYDIMGRALPVGQSLRRGSYAGTLTLRARSEPELNGISEILADGQVLLMRAPATWPGYGSRYIQIGDADFAQQIRVPDGRFTVTLPWTEVSRPAGLAEAGVGYRWADLTGGYASWLAVISAYQSWNDVVLDAPLTRVSPSGTGTALAAIAITSSGISAGTRGSGAASAAIAVTSSGVRAP